MPSNVRDLFAELGLQHDANKSEIAAKVALITRQANALSVTSPQRAQRLRDLSRDAKATLLSSDEALRQYRNSLAEYDAAASWAADSPVLPGSSAPSRTGDAPPQGPPPPPLPPLSHTTGSPGRPSKTNQQPPRRGHSLAAWAAAGGAILILGAVVTKKVLMSGSVSAPANQAASSAAHTTSTTSAPTTTTSTTPSSTTTAPVSTTQPSTTSSAPVASILPTTSSANFTYVVQGTTSLWSGPGFREYQMLGSAAAGTVVQASCALYGASVSGDMIWDYVGAGWISDSLLAPTSASFGAPPACWGSISTPTPTTAAPSDSTGPFPVYSAGAQVGVYANPSPSSSLNATLPDGTLVSLSCFVKGPYVASPPPYGGNSYWDQVVAPTAGWIPDALVNSHRTGPPVPPC